MARPKGSRNKGFNRRLSFGAEEINFMCSKGANMKELRKTANAYNKLLKKAIKFADPQDLSSVQKLSSGIAALTRAVVVLDKTHDEMYIDTTRGIP